MKRGISDLQRHLLLGASIGLMVIVGPAAAQPAGKDVETVVVTGTSIRGAAPAGEPVISIGRSAIEDSAAVSVQQLLTTQVPQLNSFGTAGQTDRGFEPRLRSLGGSSSGATLVLIDGHRINPGGGLVNVSDPNVVPAGAVDHIEILADGASAIYGSDAVAGVINIITRKDYDGIEMNAQVGTAQDYNSVDMGLVFGHAWDNGGILTSYEYSHRTHLLAADRDFVSGNQSSSGPGATGKGGANFNTFACSPATAVPATGQPGAGLVFAYPYSGAGLVNNNTLNGLCSTATQGDLLPDSISHRLYISAHQDLWNGRLKLSGSFVYANNWQTTDSPRGTVTNVTIYGPGSTPPGGVGQINPFFAGPPGVKQETISYDFNDLFGPGAKSVQIQQSVMGTLAADFAISDSWNATLTLTIGDPVFTNYSIGTVNPTDAYLTLNGTSVANGSPTANLIGNSRGIVTTATQLPLTAANAFNPFAPGAPGTSAATLNALTGGQNNAVSERPIDDVVGKIDGSVFDLPGGTVKVALGGEYYSFGQVNDNTSRSPLSGAGQALDFYTHVVATPRHVVSGFAEVNIPLVGEEMNVPFVRKLAIDIAGRIDDYSDLTGSAATTKNPKFGINWDPIKDLTVRAAYGTSFVAPTVGSTQLGTTASAVNSYFGNGGASFTLPQGFPNRSVLGCAATGTCTITSGSGFDGIQVSGNNPALKPQTGIEWSQGFDWAPKDYLQGLFVSMTYWGTNFKGVITNQTNANVAVNTPGLGEQIFIIGPSAAQIAAAESGRTPASALPTNISFIYTTFIGNYFNFRAAGVDFNFRYAFDTDFGSFTVSEAGELKTHFLKQIGTGPWVRALSINNTTNTFSPIRFTGRTAVNWQLVSWTVNLGANYVSSYYNTDPNAPYAASPCPSNVTGNGLGCQHVGDYLTYDAHIAYNFKGAAWADGLQLYLDVSNLFDKKPPFVDSADSITPNGVVGFSANPAANPIGRMLSAGFRKAW